MPPKSFASKLPTDLRQELDRQIVSGQLSVDDLWEWLRNRGYDVSRSAVGRHSQSVNEAAKEMRKAREISAVFARELGPDVADGNLGQALIEVVQTIVFRQMLPKLSNVDAEPDAAEDLMLLGTTVQKLVSAEKMNAERILKIRKETISRAVQEIKKVGEEINAPKDMLKKFEKGLIGINL